MQHSLLPLVTCCLRPYVPIALSYQRFSLSFGYVSLWGGLSGDVMEKSQKILLSVLAVVFVGIIATCVVVSVKSDGSEQIADFSAPTFDTNVVLAENLDIPESANYKSLFIKEGFKISMASTVNITNNLAEIHFTSEADNAVWLKLVLLTTDGKRLGESGLIEAGKHLKQIEINNLSSNNDEIIVKILSYEPNTYYSLGTAQVKASIIKNK